MCFQSYIEISKHTSDLNNTLFVVSSLHILLMGVYWHISKLFHMHITLNKHPMSKLKAGDTSENANFTENDLHLTVPPIAFLFNS